MSPSPIGVRHGRRFRGLYMYRKLWEMNIHVVFCKFWLLLSASASNVVLSTSRSSLCISNISPSEKRCLGPGPTLPLHRAVAVPGWWRALGTWRALWASSLPPSAWEKEECFGRFGRVSCKLFDLGIGDRDRLGSKAVTKSCTYSVERIEHLALAHRVAQYIWILTSCHISFMPWPWPCKILRGFVVGVP